MPSASITNDGLEVVDYVPNSAVELLVKEKVGGDRTRPTHHRREGQGVSSVPGIGEVLTRSAPDVAFWRQVYVQRARFA